MIGQDHITSVEIETLIQDSMLNIRALEIDESDVYFASANSDIQVLKKGKRQFESLFPIDQVNKPNFRSLAIADNNVFAMAIGSPALLYKNGKIVYREDHEKAFYDALHFWNDQEGIAIGDPTEDCMSIIITRDGGETWKKVSCASLPKSNEGEAAFAASDGNIAIVGDLTWVATGGMSSRVLFSTDKGLSWSISDAPVIQGKSTTGLYAIDFYDQNLGVGIGGDYTDAKSNINNKIITLDGGKTWSTIASGQEPGYRSCVQFVPNSKGNKIVSIGFEGIDVSNDGGKTWKHLSDEGFYTIRFEDEHTAYAAGKGRVSKVTFK